MEDTVADSSHATPLERRMVAGRPSFAALDGLKRRMLDSLVGGATLPLGRYRLGRVIGAGSFGTVYEAEDLRLGRRVAFKLITCARTSTETSRVLREARMLATLSHPNIVHVFEVGLVDDERRAPYVVMELVPGRTLRRWLAESRRSWREIVETVVQAAHGLRAAHVAGVVHRDVKPDNVLLGDDGRPRVIDFGLARSLDDHAEDSAAHTLGGESSTELTPTGQVMGTPAYMAPEVFGSRCTAQSDQYSLCVTLYEALFGERPFTAHSTEDLRTQILAREPSLPRNVRHVPPRIQRAVMRGLRRDPTQRWPDLSGLIEALERALQPARVVPAALLLTGLLGASAVIAAERDTECITGDRAWEPARELPRLSDAVEHSRLAYERAWRDTEQRLCTANGTVDADQRHCLDQRARDAIAMLAVLAELEESDDDPVRELPAPAECASSDRDVVARPDPEIATRVDRLQQPLSRLRALTSTTQVTAGLELAATLAEELRRLDYPPMLVEVGYLRGRLLFLASDYAGAAVAFEDAFWIAQLEQLDRLAAGCATELLRVHGFYRRDVEAARRWAAHAEAAFTRAGIDPLASATYQVGLAGLAELEGDLERTVELLQQGLDAAEMTDGARSEFRATVLNHLGIALYRLERYADAADALEEAAAGYEEFHGAVSPSRAAALDNLGLCMGELGRLEEALTHHREALTIREATLDEHHVDVAASYGNMADVLDRLGRHDEAHPFAERAYERFVSRLGEGHPWVAQSLEIRGRIDMHRGRTESARQDFAGSVRMFTAAGSAEGVARVQALARELDAGPAETAP